jgi:hypothetical protein
MLYFSTWHRTVEIQTKAIALAEACAQKAAAKAEALRIQLASVKAADEATRTLTRDRGAHVPNKSKGTGGGVALLTPTNFTSIIASPQRKGLSPKKRVMVHSPHQLTIRRWPRPMKLSPQNPPPLVAAVHRLADPSHPRLLGLPLLAAEGELSSLEAIAT